MTFNIGDKIAWDSQAGGSWTTKVGQVVTEEEIEGRKWK